MSFALPSARSIFLKEISPEAVPVHLVTETGFESWKADQPERTRAFFEQTGFRGTPGTCSIEFGPDGQLERVHAGIAPEPAFFALAPLVGSLIGALSKETLDTRPFRLACDETSSDPLTRICAGWGCACYRYDAMKGSPSDPIFPKLVLPEQADADRVNALVESAFLTRDLINTPANRMGPEELEAAARDVAGHFSADIHVISDAAVLKKDFPMIYAVGDSSPRRPRLIDIRWGNPDHPKLSLVGKGVCFDTGGLDLKPPQAMALMKKDMGGAAHVLGLAWLVMALQLKIRLRVLIPAVENATSGCAFRPQDVLNSRKGLTVEVGDTDAEGRLVLGDALTFACEESPDLLLDYATLTGAARVALGYEIPVLFANREKTENDLKRLSFREDDAVWPLPVWQPYRREMDSSVADINNIGSGRAGAIHGALFLQEFVTPETDWAHFDVYGWENGGRPGRPKGGLEMGLRTALALIEERFRA